MLEFVFKKAALRKLIDESGDSNQGNVIIKLEFSGKMGAFSARVTAACEDSTSKASKAATLSASEVEGCPRPPGCE